MPSTQLARLCEQIEKQATDHFGKFYMYASLLNSVAVRDKPFVEGLPKYSSFFSTKELNIGGELPTEFTQQLTSYAREFINSQPQWSKTLHNIVMAYFRKGKITDLSYIIDQMLSHLLSIQGHQSHNHDIYQNINFIEKKQGLIQFVQQISNFNHQLLSTADSGCNTVLSALAVVTGLVLVLASIFSIVPLIVGLPLVIGGAYGTYHFLSKTKGQAELLETELNKIIQATQKLPQDESFFGDKNHNPFYATIFKPLPYVAITASEQLAYDEAGKTKCSQYRGALDDAFSTLSI